MDHLLYGAAYYLEYLPYDRLDLDVAMMKAAGINTVRIAESTWSTYEPREGEFDFHTVERVLDAMEEAGISVIVGTPTYAVPAWMVNRYPDILAETKRGRRIYGARQIMDITHPKYLFYAERIIRKLMEVSAHRKCVIGFQIDNETKYYDTAGNHVQQRFVQYLRKQFGGDLDAMNHAFGLDYWSNRVGSWEDFPDVRGTINGSLGAEFDAMVFFARRMLEAEPLGGYADVMERELYNGVLSGMGVDGTSYFYVNPLEVVPGVSGQLFGYRHDLPQRPGWYECACCPTNLVRLVTSLGSYAWSESEDTIYSHLFIGQRADLEKAEIIVESNYPRKGRVFYQINPKIDTPFTLSVHLPAFVSLESPDTQILVNGVPVNTTASLRNGYLYLKRTWRAGDEVTIHFDIPVRRVYANPRVRADAGCTAFMRGPVVYCFEGIDNGEDL